MHHRLIRPLLLSLLALALIIPLALTIRRRLATRIAALDPQTVAQQPIVPGQSLGPVSLGMTEAQVTAALGKPDSIHTPQSWQYRDPDIAINFTKTTPRTVAALFAGGSPPLTNVPYRTPEGLGLSSTRQEVLTAWGTPDVDTSESLTYRSRGIVLMLTDNRVTWLAVRTFPHTQPTTQP